MLLTSEMCTAIAYWLDDAYIRLKEDSYKEDYILQAFSHFIEHPTNWAELAHKETNGDYVTDELNSTIIEIISKTRINFFFNNPASLFAKIKKEDLDQINAAKYFLIALIKELIKNPEAELGTIRKTVETNNPTLLEPENKPKETAQNTNSSPATSTILSSSASTSHIAQSLNPNAQPTSSAPAPISTASCRLLVIIYKSVQETTLIKNYFTVHSFTNVEDNSSQIAKQVFQTLSEQTFRFNARGLTKEYCESANSQLYANKDVFLFIVNFDENQLSDIKFLLSNIFENTNKKNIIVAGINYNKIKDTSDAQNQIAQLKKSANTKSIELTFIDINSNAEIDLLQEIAPHIKDADLQTTPTQAINSSVITSTTSSAKPPTQKEPAGVPPPKLVTVKGNKTQPPASSAAANPHFWQPSINKSTQSQSFSFVLLGDVRSGKSELISNYLGKPFVGNTVSTISSEFYSYKQEINNNAINLKIWECPAADGRSFDNRNYLRNANVFLLMIDLTNPDALANAKQHLSRSRVPERANFVLVANKADLLTADHKITDEQIKKFAADNGNMPYIYTSAKTGQNVGKMFEEISRALIERRRPNFETAPELLSAIRITFIQELDQKILSMEQRIFEFTARINALKNLRFNLQTQRNIPISEIVNEALNRYSLILAVGTTNDLLVSYSNINDLAQPSPAVPRTNGLGNPQ